MSECKIINNKISLCDAMSKMNDRVEFEKTKPYLINYGLSLLTQTTKTETNFITKQIGIGTMWEDKNGFHMVKFEFCPFCGAKVNLKDT